jgi:chemotaxis methyl-accepting protein methylase
MVFYFSTLMSCKIQVIQMPFSNPNQALSYYWEKAARILRNITTGEEVSYQYLDKVVQVIWQRMPESWRSLNRIQRLGVFFHKRACALQHRMPEALYTRFNRNRPHIDLICSLADRKPQEAALKIAVIGCSKGPEVYSLVGSIRSRRPDLNLIAVGVDISTAAIEAARRAVYLISDKEIEGLSAEEFDLLFFKEGNRVTPKDWIRRDISFIVGDAKDPEMANQIGVQDIVLADNFLVHLNESDAVACLANIVSFVALGGYLSLWGIDLGLKTRFVKSRGLIPVSKNIEEVYRADEAAQKAWPWEYWGVEPFDRNKTDWMVRYATVFQIPDCRKVLEVKAEAIE